MACTAPQPAAQLGGRLLVREQEADRRKRLHAEQGVVIGLVRANLRVQVLEAAGHP